MSEEKVPLATSFNLRKVGSGVTQFETKTTHELLEGPLRRAPLVVLRILDSLSATHHLKVFMGDRDRLKIHKRHLRDVLRGEEVGRRIHCTSALKPVIVPMH